MTEDLTQALRAVLLPAFGVLRIGGADAATFLQGQFTNDVRLLADSRTQASACCTNQGRVIALARLRHRLAAGGLNRALAARRQRQHGHLHR